MRRTLALLLLAGLLGALGGCGMAQQNRRNQADATACQGGDVHACMRQGELWSGYRSGANRDDEALTRMVDAYRRACDGGLADGCLRLAGLYMLEPELASERRTKALQAALQACQLDSAAGCALAAYAAPFIAQSAVLVQRSCDLDPGDCLAAVEAIAKLPEAAFQLALGTCGKLPAKCVAATRFARSVGERGELLGQACAAGLLEQCAPAARELEQAGARERARELVRVGCRGGDQASCAALGQLLATPAGP